MIFNNCKESPLCTYKITFKSLEGCFQNVNIKSTSTIVTTTNLLTKNLPLQSTDNNRDSEFILIALIVLGSFLFCLWFLIMWLKYKKKLINIDTFSSLTHIRRTALNQPLPLFSTPNNGESMMTSYPNSNAVFGIGSNTQYSLTTDTIISSKTSFIAVPSNTVYFGVQDLKIMPVIFVKYLQYFIK